MKITYHYRLLRRASSQSSERSRPGAYLILIDGHVAETYRELHDFIESIETLSERTRSF